MSKTEKKTRCVFTIYAKPEEESYVGTDIDMEIIAYTKDNAIEQAKKILGDGYAYFRVREIISLELYKMKL